MLSITTFEAHLDHLKKIIREYRSDFRGVWRHRSSHGAPPYSRCPCRPSRSSASDALSPDLRNDKDLAYLCCDVTDRASVDSALRQVLKLYGRLDVVIANAGMVANERFLQIHPANLRQTMEVNFFGAFTLAQLAAWLNDGRLAVRIAY
jgi:NAD(P)-dependent dehydrogenase (short-subunit alcohol dehydrogenase family)